jgi:hypothetical protein
LKTRRLCVCNYLRAYPSLGVPRRAFAFRPWGALVRICIHKKVVHATKSSRHNLFVHISNLAGARSLAINPSKCLRDHQRRISPQYPAAPILVARVFRPHSSRRTGFFTSGEWALQINSCEWGQKRLLVHCKIAQQICTITAR